MKGCTFFGNRDTPQNAEPLLHDVLVKLIENGEADRFFVGNQGSFDSMVYRQLSKLEVTYGIRFFVVLAYFPNSGNALAEDPHTIFAEGFETVPPRFAIVKRNQWMLERSDCVITYVRDQTGGAARFKSLAEKNGKRIIELSDLRI